MTNKIAYRAFKYYTGLFSACCGKFLLLASLILLNAPYSFAQKNDDQAEEELIVTIEVKGLGTFDGPALMNGKEVLLSVNNLFDFLRIKNVPTTSFDSISGFYINVQDAFVIDRKNSKVIFKDKVYEIGNGDLVKTDGNLYLNLKYFKTIFGLDGIFTFRRLWVTLTSNTELPAIREARLDLMRSNVNNLRGELKADTTLPRRYPMAHLGVVDWALISTQQSQGNNETRANLGFGGVLAGGEANASLNYYSSQPFTEKQQFYQWRLVNNENAALRQVLAGKIFTRTVANLFAPLVGVQFNNTPTIQRRSYGKYTMSNKTEPGWTVELYINDVLVDYKKADASGFYSFEVPLIYGYSVIKLRFYGPWGEERTSEQFISVPFNFLPAREFEYAATAGIVEDGKDSRFGRISTNYGLSNHMTVGGGFEYLSTIRTRPEIPFVNSSFRISSHLLLTGEYAYGVRTRGLISYRLPFNMQLDADYTKYAKGQTAIFFNYTEERKLSLTVPVKAFGTAVFSRLALNQIILPNSRYTNTELAFSGSIRRVGVNLTTYASFTPEAIPYTYSLASLAFMLPKHVYLTTQVQYDYKHTRLDFMKFTFERNLLGKGFVNLTYQEYFNSNNRNVLLGFRYDLSFARVNVTALQGNNKRYSRVQSASGSIMFDGKTNYVNANSRSNIGRGSVVVEPFLDMNCNDKWDKGEPRAPGMDIRVNGGRTVNSVKDTTNRIFELEPYNSYNVTMDRNSFDNISWQLKKRTYKVTAIPNYFTSIQVPVAVVGEASGSVFTKGKNGKRLKGMGQIIVQFCDSTGQMVNRIITESDGYFSFLGLAPGAYSVKLDPVQLGKLHLAATPASIPIYIKLSREGDVADNLDFSLTPRLSEKTEVMPDQEVEGPKKKADEETKEPRNNGGATEQKNEGGKADMHPMPERSDKTNELRQEEKGAEEQNVHIDSVGFTAIRKHKVHYNELHARDTAIVYHSDSGRGSLKNTGHTMLLANRGAQQHSISVPVQVTVWDKVAQFFFADVFNFITQLFQRL